MSKSDFPALRMLVEGGRLVPAGQFDQERLNSYRRGTVVFVHFTEEKDRVLVKKWWAVLGLVVKQCQTPWKTKEEASEAIKLALGIVNLSKTVRGQIMQYPKSLKDLEDPELQEALDNMTELLSRLTGVDVSTLRKEATAAAGAEEPSNPELEQEPVSEPPPEPAGATASSAPRGDEDTPSSSPAQDPEREVLVRFARDILPKAANTTIPTSTLTAIERRWATDLANLSEERRAQARTISESMRAIANGKTTLKKAAEFFEEMFECAAGEIGRGA